ncbi:MAG: hypothetical protein HY736_15380 [Verrucomicrobia bacterium]|nr:hypothetical protein [Verrucomicrobiota bacterium]
MKATRSTFLIVFALADFLNALRLGAGAAGGPASAVTMQSRCRGVACRRPAYDVETGVDKRRPYTHQMVARLNG